jgi:hypothetical protein
LANDEKVRELLRRVNAAGIPVANPIYEQKVPSILIRPDFESYYGSELFDFGGGTGLVLPLKIVPSVSGFIFSDFYVELDRWRDARFRLLEEMENSDWPHYEFYGRSDLTFQRNEVLNRLIADGKPLRRGCPVCGLLIASFCETMPDDIRHRDMLEGVIWIYDQFEQTHSASIRLRAKREIGKLPKGSCENKKLRFVPLLPDEGQSASNPEEPK